MSIDEPCWAFRVFRWVNVDAGKGYGLHCLVFWDGEISVGRRLSGVSCQADLTSERT